MNHKRYRHFAHLIPLTLLLSPPAHTCELQWDYEDSSWIEGFRLYQDGQFVGQTTPDARVWECASAGLVPSTAPITLTAVRGPDESAHSEPAVFTLKPPHLRIKHPKQW